MQNKTRINKYINLPLTCCSGNSITPTWSTKALPSLCLTASPGSNMKWLWQRLQKPLLPYKFFFLPPPSEPPSHTLSNYRRLAFLHPKSIFHQRWVAGLDHSQLWNMLGTSAFAYIMLFSLHRKRPLLRDQPNYQHCMRELYTTLQTLTLPPRGATNTFPSDYKLNWLEQWPVLNSQPFNLWCVSYLLQVSYLQECQVLHLLRGLSLWSLMAGCSQLVFGKLICGTLEVKALDSTQDTKPDSFMFWQLQVWITTTGLEGASVFIYCVKGWKSIGVDG